MPHNLKRPPFTYRRRVHHFGTGKAKALKALVAAAPLEGIDLSRERDFGRDLDL